MSSIFVILYETPRAAVNVLASLYTRASDFEPPVVETNVHFVPKFTPTAFSKTALYYDNYWDFGPPVQETNTNFIAKFQPSVYANSIALRQNAALDVPIVIVQPDTATPFVPRFQQPTYQISIGLRQNVPSDVPVVVTQPDTAQSFIARFNQTTFARTSLYYNQNADVEPRVQETNPHFVGKFSQTKFARTSLYYDNHWDFQPPVQETNPHFVGKSTPTTYRILPGYRQQPSYDTFSITITLNVSELGDLALIGAAVYNLPNKSIISMKPIPPVNASVSLSTPAAPLKAVMSIINLGKLS